MRLFKPWVDLYPSTRVNGLEEALGGFGRTHRGRKSSRSRHRTVWRSFGHKAIDHALSNGSRGLRRATAPSRGSFAREGSAGAARRVQR